jgi:hypothetical protein
MGILLCDTPAAKPARIGVRFFQAAIIAEPARPIQRGWGLK